MATEAVNFKATLEGEQAKLTWTASETTNLLNWLIEEKVGTEGTWKKLPLLESTVTSTTISVSLGQTSFRVWAVVKQAAKEASVTVSPPPAELKLALTVDKTGVQVLSAPVGSTVDFALCSEAGGGNVLYEPKGLKVGGIAKGKPGHEWIDAHVTGQSEWWSKAHGRIKVEVASVEPPPHEEPPVEEPPHEEPPKTTGFKRGICAGGWSRSQEISDLKKCGPNPAVRLENPGETVAFSNSGTAVIYLNSGGTSLNIPHLSEEGRAHRNRALSGLFPSVEINRRNEKLGYSSGGVKSLNAATIVSDALAVVKKHPDIWCYEYLNEPGGNWFWGSGAESAENSAAYVKQLKALHEGFASLSHRPLILASADGGHAGDNTWLRNMLKADPNVVNYVDAFSNHPYDGGSSSASSTLVHWGSVEETHRLTGKPVIISEYGRPLLAKTGDSPQSSESQQASADGAMVRKAKESGFVLAVTIYGYRGNSAPCYAVFKENDEPRPAVSAIANA